MCNKYLDDLEVPANLFDLLELDEISDDTDDLPSLSSHEEITEEEYENMETVEEPISDADQAIKLLCRLKTKINAHYVCNMYENEIRDLPIIHSVAYYHQGLERYPEVINKRLCHDCFNSFVQIGVHVNSIKFSNWLDTEHRLDTGDNFHGSIYFDMNYDDDSTFFCYNCNTFLYKLQFDTSVIENTCQYDCWSVYKDQFEPEIANNYYKVYKLGNCDANGVFSF